MHLLHFSPPRPDWRHRLIAGYIRGPDHRGKRRAVRWLRRRLKVETILLEVIPGVVMDLDPGDFVQHEIITKGGYELASLARFDRLLVNARGVLDIGGHHGQYTLRAARALAARGGRVFTFEPTPGNASALLRNATLSGLNNIDLCTVALSDSPGILRMTLDHMTNTGGSHLVADTAVASAGLATHVAVRSFADVAPLIPSTAFDLVKIDVEGYEARVLASMFASSGPRPRHLLCEYLPHLFDYGVPETLPTWLERHGYRVRTVTGEDFVPGAPLPEDNLWAELRT